MRARLRASILVIGDEILAGYVQDTNSGWLAQRLRLLGIPLDRVVTVPDDAATISDVLGDELARDRPRVVLTSGGVGSTPDDVTVAAVAAHLGMGLRVEPQIAARIERSLDDTRRQGMVLSAASERAMRKMAQVPEGAYVLRGTRSQGVAVDVHGGAAVEGGATIVILPGIPTQLQRIMHDSVEPALLKGRGEPEHVEEIRHGYPESTLSGVFDRLVADFPDVHLGSYPGAECIVRLKGREDRVLAARALVEDELAQIGEQPGAEALRQRWAARWG